MTNFISILEQSALKETDKITLRTLADYYNYKHPAELCSRSVFFTGNVGTGKTHLARALALSFLKPLLYFISEPLSRGKACKSIHDLGRHLEKGKEQILFLDDLDLALERNENDEIVPKDRLALMHILDTVNSDPGKILIITTNEGLDEPFLDRLGIRIYIDIPSVSHKMAFLRSKFQRHLTAALIRYLASNSIGYNYRDLPELVRLAYRLGGLSKVSIRKALQEYKPTQLYGFKVLTGIETTLNDIIGKEKLLKATTQFVRFHRQERWSQRLGIEQQGLLFHGPPGTGKTFMARAIAGELGYPLICVSGENVERFNRVREVIELGKRYRNCIIFIDEAEKVLGNARYGEDNPLIGEFNRVMDGADKANNGLIILAVNELARLGDAFRDRFMLMQFDPPSSEERWQFLRTKGKNLPFFVDYEYLTLKSKGMSFRDLSRLWNDLMYWHFETKEAINPLAISKILGTEEQEHMIG